MDTSEKPEFVVLTKKKIPTVAPIQVGETMEDHRKSKAALKCLAVIINTKMSFFAQIRNIADKAANRMFPVYRLMSNVECPFSSRCRLLISAINNQREKMTICFFYPK